MDYTHTCSHCHHHHHRRLVCWQWRLMHSAPLDISRPSFLLSVNGLSSENSTEAHWSLCQHKHCLGRVGGGSLCLVVWSGTPAGLRCKCFEMVWHDTWSLSPPLNVPGVELYSSSAGLCSQWSGHQCGDVAKRHHLYTFLWLFQSYIVRVN